MSYSKLVDSQLKKAFNLMKDLATPATFNMKVSGSFNFGAKAPEDFEAAPVQTKIVVYDGKRAKGDGPKVTSKQFMVKAKDVGDLKAFDKVTFDGNTWTVGQIIKGTGYILIAEAVRAGG